jgi:spore coat polysaccharide biosynthesis protein SpsF (cytidylyltransferase family)
MGKGNNLAILQARMSSKRLPGKVLMEINGKQMFNWQIQMILQSKEISKIVVATSEYPIEVLDGFTVDPRNWTDEK